MNETIDVMKRHISVRRFTDERIPDATLREIIEAGRSASSWKNFQSTSIIVIRSQEKKEAFYAIDSQPAVLSCDTLLVFVGDLNRASKAATLHDATFDAKGPENLLISSVDTALVAQNTLLAAESLGYGGVMMGLLRQHSTEIADLLQLPDYTYPIFSLALGKPDQHHPVKPRLPYETVVFEEVYQEQTTATIKAYDAVQTAYAGSRQQNLWSERIVQQFGQKEQAETKRLLEQHKLL
ncbi:nitroreductase family protein [Streptococcus sp. DD13]|uniref:nitroreductase family protein n=1 Tax=Streptococcus sp. DD13 TaxID=1777881 RepID=UPI0007951907|nr:nitroreductase family protein [Streptococcus sp. DD13]KXT78204.1 Oxygen-insensitive NADPH nitroreductase [Streptococcus sp. DD13]